jgi:hypothetical protein
MRTRHSVVALILLGMAVGGCGDSSTEPPTTYESVAGNYSGSIVGTSQGVALDSDFSLVIQQTNGDLTGSYGIVGALSDGVQYVHVQGTGSLDGTVGTGTNPSVNITVTPGFCPNRSAAFSGTYDSANRLLTLVGPVQFFDTDCTVVLTYQTILILTGSGTVGAPVSMEIIAGDGQEAVAGSQLSDSLVVRLVDVSGNPVSGVPVSWEVVSGGGTVSPASVTTDGDGRASAAWTLGTSTTAEPNTARAVVEKLDPVAFTANLLRTWRLLSTSQAPSPREAPLMVYDSARNRVVLVGGISQTEGYVGDTWEFDGTTWTPITSATLPADHNLTTATMVYDSRSQQVILIPSNGAESIWIYDGATWSSFSVTNPPGDRCCIRAAYDYRHDQIVIFGGYSNFFMNDTWVLRGDAWQEIVISPDSTPSVRRSYSMGYDNAREVTIVAGGWDGGVGNDADAWAFDGTGWWLMDAPSDFAPASEKAIVFDTHREVSVLVGANVLWEWAGETWAKIVPPTPADFNGHFGAAYDQARQTIVVFGNNPYSNKTWMYGY